MEEVRRLQNRLTEFSFEISQLQSQIDAVQREKSVCQAQTVEMERMHVSMKEAMTADITYLRRLNLQLVEQQMKGVNSLGSWSSNIPLAVGAWSSNIALAVGAWSSNIPLSYCLYIPPPSHPHTLTPSHPHTLTAEQATEILREVKAAQDAYREHRDLMKMEAEVSHLQVTVA